ncbi:MAG: hypothetical protein AAFQ94_26070 [Bacteroidota bacterium]
MYLKISFSSVFFWLSVNYILAQTRLEAGYFIENDGTKVTCMISNQDWVDNPTNFKYLKNTDSNLIENTINEVQEFGIINKIKFVRKKIVLNRSLQSAEMRNQEPSEVKKETVFLKELVSGQFNLYLLSRDKQNTFYFQTADKTIRPLIDDYDSKNDKELINATFRTQLSEAVSCKNKSRSYFSKLSYDQRSLIDYFIEQNQCTNKDYYSAYEVKTIPGKSQFKVKTGIIFSSLNVDNTRGRVYDSDFGNFIVPTYGVEFEYSLSSEQKKWSLMTELMYEKFNESSNIEFRIRNHRDESYANYSALNFAVNFRRYFLLSKKSKLFANFGSLVSFSFKSFVELEETELFEISPEMRFGVGLGYNYADRVYLEVRQYNDVNWSDKFVYRVEHSSGMVMLSYRLFQSKKL